MGNKVNTYCEQLLAFKNVLTDATTAILWFFPARLESVYFWKKK